YLREVRPHGIDRGLLGMAGAVPIARPLPHVAYHVEESVAVRREAADRSGADVAVLAAVVDGENALPGIGDGRAVRRVGAHPVLLVHVAAARGELPLRFRRQITAEPACVGE